MSDPAADISRIQSHSPPPPPRREEDRDRFNRSNFAPIPNRHASDLGGDRFIPPPRERDPVPPPRGQPPMSSGKRGGDEYDADISRWERRLDRERDREEWEERDWDRERDVGAPGNGNGNTTSHGGGGGGGGNRGRRAPPPDHWQEDFDRPKRRRSPSPSYPTHRPRRFSPDPYSHPAPQPMGLPDPASLSYQLTFKQFAEWFRANHPSTAKADEEEFRRWKAGMEDPEMTGRGEEKEKSRVGMGKRYERYRKEYTSRQLYSLYLMHRSSPWFTERYSHLPEDQAERKRVNRQGRIPTVEKYLDELKLGKYDNVSFDQSDDPAKRALGSRRYSELDEPDVLDRPLGDSGDEPGKMEVPPNEKQVFVKSVPPTISRKELEQMFGSCDGFKYLALTEPSVKKSFHRVSWAQYGDEVDIDEVVKKLDGTKIDNFTFHMGVNTAPTVGRVRFAPPISNTLHRLQKDGEKAKALALKLEQELLMAEDEEEAETKEVEEVKEGEEAKEKVEKELVIAGMREAGSGMVESAIVRVLEKEGLQGEELSEQQQLQKAKLVLDHWLSYLRNGLSSCYYCVATMSFPEELQRKCIGHVRSPANKEDLDQIDESKEDKVHEGQDGVVEVKMDDAAAGTGDEKKPAGDEGDDILKMEGESGVDQREKDEDADEDGRDDSTIQQAKSNQGGGRQRPDDHKSKVNWRNNDDRWEELLESKLAPILNDNLDVTEYGGRDIEEETKRLTAPMIKQEEASKYRCKECNKLFKAPEFVMKHIVVKHGENVQIKLDMISTFNNFVLDPQHLQATPQVPAAIEDELPQMGAAPILNPAFPLGAPGGNAAAMNTNNPQQQMMFMMMQMQQAMMMQMQNGGNGMSSEGRGLAGRMGGYASNGGAGGGAVAREPLPPPPPGSEDPRAKRGRVSYMDLDDAGGGGDGGLPY